MIQIFASLSLTLLLLAAPAAPSSSRSIKSYLSFVEACTSRSTTAAGPHCFGFTGIAVNDTNECQKVITNKALDRDLMHNASARSEWLPDSCHAFGLIKRVEFYKFEVMLVGKLTTNYSGGGGSGAWVGLVLSPESRRVIEVGNRAIICKADSHEVQLLNITSSGNSLGIATTTPPNEDSCIPDSSESSVHVEDTDEAEPWMLCRFLLRSSAYDVDVLNQDLYLGLAGNTGASDYLGSSCHKKAEFRRTAGPPRVKII